MQIYYTSNQLCEDEQQKEETLIAIMTDVDLWEEGTPLKLYYSPEGLKGDVIKLTMNKPLPKLGSRGLWLPEEECYYINPTLWNRTYSYYVEETEMIGDE